MITSSRSPGNKSGVYVCLSVCQWYYVVARAMIASSRSSGNKSGVYVTTISVCLSVSVTTWRQEHVYDMFGRRGLSYTAV